MEELKPCPFCGGAARAFKRTCDKDTRYDPSHRAFPIVRCGSCGACAEGDDWTEPQVAIERWNRRAQQVEAVPQWVECAKQMPAADVIVLAFYKNSRGLDRRIRAKWVPAKTLEVSGDCDDFGEYDEDSDVYWCPEGWYEVINNWDDFRAIAVHEGVITHWMPLPPPPQST